MSNQGHLIRGMRAALTIVVAAGMLGGCKAGGGGKQATGGEPMRDLSAPVKPENRFKVSADPAAAFFRFSPQQPAGPDEQIKKETRVELISKLAGFSKVKLPNGNIGYIDSADLAHLSPKEIADEDALVAAQQAAALAAMQPATSGDANLNIGNGGNYRPPAEAGRTEPLPVADPNPTATPPPSTMFRY